MKKLAAAFVALAGLVLLASVAGCVAKPSLSTSALPSGQVGVPYSASLSASGGSGSYDEFVVQSVNLPEGLTLDPREGVISGTPTTAGTYDLTIAVTDSKGVVGKGKTLTLSIEPAS
jgi:Putative Ig domain